MSPLMGAAQPSRSPGQGDPDPVSMFGLVLRVHNNDRTERTGIPHRSTGRQRIRLGDNLPGPEGWDRTHRPLRTSAITRTPTQHLFDGPGWRARDQEHVGRHPRLMTGPATIGPRFALLEPGTTQKVREGGGQAPGGHLRHIATSAPEIGPSGRAGR